MKAKRKGSGKASSSRSGKRQDSLACLAPYEPGPLVRCVLIFGPTADSLRQAADRHCAVLDKATGRWIQIHPLGNPGLRDEFGDADREVRGIQLSDLREEWKQACAEYGDEAAAVTMTEAGAAHLWGVNLQDCPSVAVLRPGDEAPLGVISLRALWEKAGDIGAVQALMAVLDESKLLAHVESQNWNSIGTDEFGGLVTHIETEFRRYALSTGTAPSTGADSLAFRDLPVLSGQQRAFRDIFLELAPHEGLTGPEACLEYAKRRGPSGGIDDGDFRSRVVPKLKAWGLLNKKRAGYYFPQDAAARRAAHG